MPGRRTRSYTLEEVTRIVIDIPDSDISDFEDEVEVMRVTCLSLAWTLVTQTISFQMVYYKPYLVSVLDLDEFFLKGDLKIAIFTQWVLSD